MYAINYVEFCDSPDYHEDYISELCRCGVEVVDDKQGIIDFIKSLSFPHVDFEVRYSLGKNIDKIIEKKNFYIKFDEPYSDAYMVINIQKTNEMKSVKLKSGVEGLNINDELSNLINT